MKRAIALLATTVSLVLSLGSLPALAHDEDEYMAIGDSVAFGFDPLVQDRTEPENFVGYPEALARMLDLDVTNASCPGEASGGFISLTGVDNSCRPYRAAFPLHEDYDTSQLDFAVAFLKEHHDTLLVTINIGANDLFVLQKSCRTAPDPTQCTIDGLPSLLGALQANLSTIYSVIRAAGFHGTLVALTYYVTNFADPVGVFVIQLINQTVTGVTLAFGGRVASGFAAFKAVVDSNSAFRGSSCAAGLLIVLQANPLKCDIHPSPAGRDLLAQAIRAKVAIPVRD